VNIQPTDRWGQVQTNPTYFTGALSDSEGKAIRWHSPSSPRSSQVFCISAFGSLRRLPDGEDILQALLRRRFPDIALAGPWELKLEHCDRRVLDETGRATPTSVDVFCHSPSSAVCIESKFVSDAREGFGSCSQFPGHCRGFYGPGSDKKTATSANCRLEVPEGDRGARSYWRLGRAFFRDDAFVEQRPEQECPFRGSSFQLMRNILFAATSSAPAWATLAIVPDAVSNAVRKQAQLFQEQILQPEYRQRLAVASYEELIALLCTSRFDESQVLGRFLTERIAAECPSPERFRSAIT
jgi:hypothetical protein